MKIWMILIFLFAQAFSQRFEWFFNYDGKLTLSDALEQKNSKDFGKINKYDEQNGENDFYRYWVYAFIGDNLNFHSIKQWGELSVESSKGSGVNFGIGFQYFVNSNFALSINLFIRDERYGSLKMRGSWVSVPEDDRVRYEYGPNVDMDIKLIYFVVNPALRLYLGKFYFETGPCIGFLSEDEYILKTSYVGIDDNSNVVSEGIIEFSNKIEAQATRFGLPIGIGYELNLWRFRVFAGGRYDIGLSYVKNGVNWKVSSVQIFLGLRFGF